MCTTAQSLSSALRPRFSVGGTQWNVEVVGTAQRIQFGFTSSKFFPIH
jgi:hypothetical protein